MVAARIALRYLLSRKSHNAVNVISLVSMGGIAVATMAIVIILSVFNGFYDLAQSRLSLLDPQIKIEPTEGKIIADADSLVCKLGAIPEIACATPVIEEQAMAIVGERQMPIRLKGVIPESYDSVTDLRGTIIAGSPWDPYWADIPTITLSVGAANTLRALIGDGSVMGLYVPRRIGRINPANPMTAFRSDSVAVSSVFRVDQQEYDSDFAITDIDVLRRLLNYTTEASAIELRLHPSVDTDVVIARLRDELGTEFTVKGRIEQQAESFRMIEVEKWITFLLLGFILIVASFNIISTLSLLIIEKQDSIATLTAMGADRRMLRSIFAIQGWLIAMAGGLIGTLTGLILSLCQQWFGLIRLSGDPSALSITAYPVRVDPVDILIVAALVVAIGLISSWITVRSVGRRSY